MRKPACCFRLPRCRRRLPTFRTWRLTMDWRWRPSCYRSVCHRKFGLSVCPSVGVEDTYVKAEVCLNQCTIPLPHSASRTVWHVLWLPSPWSWPWTCRLSPWSWLWSLGSSPWRCILSLKHGCDHSNTGTCNVHCCCSSCVYTRPDPRYNAHCGSRVKWAF